MAVGYAAARHRRIVALLLLMVQLVSVALPSLYRPAPTLAVPPLTVQSVTFNVPPY